MKCPYCADQEDKVIDSRPADDGATIRRRRECLSCRKRYTTYEKVESIPVLVIKKDGSRQPYERVKVQKGILRACEKRNVTAEQLEKLVDGIEGQIFNSLEREITTEFIGGLVMDRLRLLDEVAYVRFASVYRHFKDIKTFMSELNKLIDEKT